MPPTPDITPDARRDVRTTSAPGPGGPAARPSVARLPMVLLAAAHPAPAIAVTVLAALLAGALGVPPGRAALVVLAVLTSQLSIGWSNDLIDLARDRRVGRTDKPLASGALPVSWARTACALAVVATVPLGFALGLRAGLLNLLCTAAGWVYNLGVKATAWSWVPYVAAFGAIPALVGVARPGGALPPVWMPVAGALLGVGAHLLNVLPDLGDDAATGVRGLPHRIGARRTPAVATTVLVVASLVIVVGSGVGVVPAVAALALVAVLAVVSLRGSGRVPFAAAVGVALVDVVLLVAAS